MAGFIERGTFTAPTTAGQQTVNLIDGSFGTVKFIRLWCSYRTAVGAGGGHVKFCSGLGSYRGSAPQQAYCSVYSADGVVTADTSRGGDTTAILKILDSGTPTVEAECDLVSLGNAQFTLDWVDPPAAAIVVHYEAWGEAALADALVDSFTATTGAGTINETVVAGFGSPDLIFWQETPGTAGDSAGAMRSSHGWGRSDTEQQATMLSQNDGTADMVVVGFQRASWALVANMGAGGDTTAHMDLRLTARSSWPADGFQVDKATPPGSARVQLYAALKFAAGVAVTMGESSTPTTASTVTLAGPGAGYSAKYLLLAHSNFPVQATPEGDHADLGYWGIGSYDGARQGHAGWWQDDAATVSIAGVTHSESEAIDMYTPSADGTKVSAATASFDGDDALLDFTADPDTVARGFIWLIVAGLQTVQAVGAIASQETFGSGRANLIAKAAGAVVSAEAFGQTTARLVVTPAGVASAEAFGTPWLPRLYVVGIASQETFGQAKVVFVVEAAGAVAGAEALGSPRANRILRPTGLASAEGFGEPDLIRLLRAAGSASAEAFGSQRAIFVVKAAGDVSSSEAFGEPNLRLVSSIRAVGAIASQETFGQHRANFVVRPLGLATAEAFGTPLLPRLYVAGIASAEVFGLPGVRLVVKAAGGVSSAETFGAAALRRVVRPQGLASSEALAEPDVARVLRAAGIAGEEALGAPFARLVVRASALGSEEAFGEPDARFVIRAQGVSSAEALGAPLVLRLIRVVGLTSGEAFGVATVTAAGAPTVTPVLFGGVLVSDVPRYEVFVMDGETFLVLTEDVPLGDLRLSDAGFGDATVSDEAPASILIHDRPGG